ncbi:hypothetical protein ACFSKL_10100 [Belliella marina]|uniref:Peptidase family M23 n=1 Tax=Belliella marina TaxID=1644146 RepID=A0ABW4VQV9_9BACT
MNRIFCILIAALLFPSLVNAQVNLYIKKDKNGEKILVSENSDIFPYSIIINLQEFENLEIREVSGRYFIAQPGKNVLAKMKIKDPAKPLKLEYTSQVVRGKYNPNFNDNMPFLLPVPEGIEVTVSKPIKEEEIDLGDLDKKSAGVMIHFKEPTFICAPRKGIVTQINDNKNANWDQDSFEEENNFIEFYHEDGTFSRLYVFRSKTSRVKVGDVVYPGMELAESAVLDQQVDPYVRFVRLITVKDGYNLKQKHMEVAFVSSSKSSLKPENGFKMISVHPKKWITSEMSNKEIKKYMPYL